MNSPSFRQPRPTVRVVQTIVIVLIATLLGSPFPVLAQGSTVYGTITDRNGRPVVNILVLIGQNYGYTDVSGRYKIVGLSQGRQRMVCRRGSIVLWQGQVEITGSEMVLNRRLT
jgi:hypothetical protein